MSGVAGLGARVLIGRAPGDLHAGDHRGVFVDPPAFGQSESGLVLGIVQPIEHVAVAGQQNGAGGDAQDEQGVAQVGLDGGHIAAQMLSDLVVTQAPEGGGENCVAFECEVFQLEPQDFALKRHSPGRSLRRVLSLTHDLHQDLAHGALYAVQARCDPVEQGDDGLGVSVGIHGA